MNPRESDAWTLSFIGRTLARRYRITRVLGAGGVGAVFEAEHLAVGRRVAIKILLPGMLEKESVVERFHREARAAAACARSGIVEVTDLDQDPIAGPFLVMEYLEGETLSDRLTRRGAMSVDQALSIAVPMLETLAAVHARDIVHRDLKPGNVFLSIGEHGSEVVKILDFGMARAPVAQDGSVPLTLPGSVLGTPRYMAPEQALGDPTIDARADLYAVGAIMYTCLAGHPPYSDVTADRALIAVLTGPPRPLPETRPGLPGAVVAVVERAMARDPNQRFPDAVEMLRVLRTVGEPTAVGSAPTLDLPALPTLGMAASPSSPGPASAAVDFRSSAPPHQRASSSPQIEHATVGARPGSLRAYPENEIPPTGAHATVPANPAQLAQIAAAMPPAHGPGSVASQRGSAPGPVAQQPWSGSTGPQPWGGASAQQPWSGQSYAPMGAANAPPMSAAPAPQRSSGCTVLTLAGIVGLLGLGALVLAVVLVTLSSRPRSAARGAPLPLPVPTPVDVQSRAEPAPIAPVAPPVTSYTPEPNAESVDAAIPPNLRALLERGRAAMTTGQYDAARMAYREVEQSALGIAMGRPRARALAYADLGLGDIEMAYVSEIPPIMRITETSPIISRMNMRNRALEHYADAMRRGEIDINVCATVRMGRADERTGDVFSRLRAERPGATPIVSAYRETGIGMLRGARTHYQAAATLDRYSSTCAAEARAGAQRMEQRLAQP